MRFRFLLIFVLILYAFCSGCSDSELEKTKTELTSARERLGKIELSLDEANKDLETVKAENMRLTSENTKLQDDFSRLKLESGLLSDNYEELKAWSKKLVGGYGPGIWYMDESDRPVFVKSMKSSKTDDIARELNRRFRKDGLPEIILKKVSDRKAYLGVDNEELLTQRMGSFGARSYMNAVIYSLTSIEGIDCIYFEFKEGDHAIPGEYCK